MVAVAVVGIGRSVTETELHMRAGIGHGVNPSYVWHDLKAITGVKIGGAGGSGMMQSELHGPSADWVPQARTM
jgi:hypothetical protein